RPRLGLGARQRERGRHRARASHRRLGCARAHNAALRLAASEADDRTRHPVSRGRQRRGPQRGDALMQAQTALASAPSVPARRALAAALGAALVAIAAQIAVPLPGTPGPLTRQPPSVPAAGWW